LLSAEHVVLNLRCKMCINTRMLGLRESFPTCLQAYFFSMTLDNMNSVRFIPSKNYSTNRVDSGILQLSDGTHLTIDETALTPGQLSERGVKNIQVRCS